MFICLIVCFFVYRFVCFCFKQSGTPTENSHENYVKIQLDLTEILRIRSFDWHDGGGKEKGRRREGEKKGRNPTL